VGTAVQQNLEGIPETLLISLWARAFETNNKSSIIRDDQAVEMVMKIDYDSSKFDGAWMSQTGVAVSDRIVHIVLWHQY
jgi:O-methyltransferase involved in polyketide biosynthesis